MVIQLPQDPRAVQQQQFSQLAIQGLMDLFETKEQKKLKEEQNQRQLELMQMIGLVPQTVEAQQEAVSGDASLSVQQEGTSPQNRRVLTQSQLAMMEASDDPQLKTLASIERRRQAFEQKERELSDKNFREEQKAKRQTFESDRKFSSDQTRPFVENMTKEGLEIDNKESMLNLVDNALRTQDVSFFSSDNLAKLLGDSGLGAGLVTPEGAIINTALKEFLLSNISRAGSRPNQWIEQQISSALVKIGRSEAANRATVEVLRHEIEASKLRQQVFNEIAEADRQETSVDGRPGFIKADVEARVRKEMDKRLPELQKQLGVRLKLLQEVDLSPDQLRKNVKKKPPKNTPLTPATFRAMKENILIGNPKIGETEAERKALKRAKDMGYEIISPQEMQKYVDGWI